MRVNLILLIMVSSLRLVAQDEGAVNKGTSSGIRTSLTFQLYNSRPSKDSRAEEDPALMLDFSYPLSPRFYLGVGGGLQAPHFNTSLVPVYLNTEYTPFLDRGYVLKARLGKFIPLSPDEFKGGLFSEYTIGYDFPSSKKSNLRILLGYSHQRMIREIPDFWWATDRRTTYRYNRLTVGFGLNF